MLQVGVSGCLLLSFLRLLPCLPPLLQAARDILLQLRHALRYHLRGTVSAARRQRCGRAHE
jgi:hypothetical protein